MEKIVKQAAMAIVLCVMIALFSVGALIGVMEAYHAQRLSMGLCVLLVSILPVCTMGIIISAILIAGLVCE